jgi:beta-N-acetylhexosaminidase
MEEEPEFRTRVRDAARRVLELKLKHLRGNTQVPIIPDLKKLETELPNPEGSAFFQDLAARSVTVVKNGVAGTERNGAVFPLEPEKAGKVFLAGQYLDFFSTGKIAYPGASAYWYSSAYPTPDLLRLAQAADTIIVCLSDPMGVGLLENLRYLGKRMIAFSVLSPVYLEEVSWVDGAIAVYSYSKESFIAGFSAILGRIPARGKLPFSREAASRSLPQ